MPKTAVGKLKIRAIDNATATLDRIKKKTAGMTRAIKKSTLAFKRQNRQTKNMRKNLSKVGSKMTSIGRGMTVGLTAPVALIGAMALRTSVNFQKGMNKVKALTRATAGEMGAMRKQALSLGRTTVFSATEAADAMAFFGQAGFKTNEIMASVPATLDLASASSTGLAETADILSNVMGGFNVEAEQAGFFANVLAAGTAKGNTNLTQLGEAMKDAAPVAQQFGSSIEETTAFIAKLGDAGIQGSKAGTTLKNMFLNLSAGTSTQKAIMKGLGVETQDSAGNMRNMTDILADMNKQFLSKGITQAQKQGILKEVFGKRAIAGAGVLINAVAKIEKVNGIAVNSIDALTNSLERQDLTAKDMAKTMQEGLPGAMTVLKSSSEGVLLSIMDLRFGGEKLSTRIGDLIKTVSDFFEKLSTTHTWLLKLIVVFGVMVAVIGPMLILLGAMITIAPFLITGFSAIAIAMGLTNIELLLMIGGFAALLAPILLIAAAAFTVWDNWDSISEVFMNAFTEPLQTLKDLFFWLLKIATFGGINLGDEGVNEKLRREGFNLTGAGENGDDTKADKALRSSAERRRRERNAQIDVNFSNMPQGATVVSQDKMNLIRTLTGSMDVI